MKAILTALMLAGALSAPVRADPLAPYGVFVFSNICEDEYGGDFDGDRLTLIRTKTGDTLLYEYGAGPLQGPFLAEDLIIKGASLRAHARTPDGLVDLTATFEDKRAMLTPRFDYEKAKAIKPEALPRVNDYIWKACPAG